MSYDIIYDIRILPNHMNFDMISQMIQCVCTLLRRQALQRRGADCSLGLPVSGAVAASAVVQLRRCRGRYRWACLDEPLSLVVVRDCRRLDTRWRRRPSGGACPTGCGGGAGGAGAGGRGSAGDAASPAPEPSLCLACHVGPERIVFSLLQKVEG